MLLLEAICIKNLLIHKNIDVKYKKNTHVYCLHFLGKYYWVIYNMAEPDGDTWATSSRGGEATRLAESKCDR